MRFLVLSLALGMLTTGKFVNNSCKIVSYSILFSYMPFVIAIYLRIFLTIRVQTVRI